MNLEPQMEIIFQTFNSSTYYPNKDNSDRYKLHDIVKMQSPIKLIYGNFYKYYQEENKTIENMWEYFENAEFYPFILILEHWILLLQHKSGFWNKHPINEVVQDFKNNVSEQLKICWISWWINKIEINRDQDDILKFFFDKSNRIKKVEADSFSLQRLEKNRERQIYTYFNPRASEIDAITQTEEYTTEHTKKLSVEAEDWKSLWKVPPVRIAVASAENIKLVEWESADNEVFFYSPKTKKIEVDLNESISNSDVVKIVAEFLKYFKWEKIEINDEVDEFIHKWLFEWKM